MSGKFNSIINSKRPVLVDFYADWCMPCKQVTPILKQVKAELKEQVRIIKVNVDKNPAIATKFQIRNIPTLILFKEGEVKWKVAGVRQKAEIEAVVRNNID